MADDISDIVIFNIERRLTSTAKVGLEQLERLRDLCIKLEKILNSAGFEDCELFKGEETFKMSRKILLDVLGENKRELEDLVNKYIIIIKK